MGNCICDEFGSKKRLQHWGVLKFFLIPSTKWEFPARTITTDDINHFYILTQTEVGRGSFGLVRKCIQRDSGQIFAVKSVCKVRVSDLKCLRREISVLALLSHQNILSLESAFENKYFIHLVTPLYSGGQLYEHWKQHQPYSEEKVSRLIIQIVDAVEYCHGRGIVHRDLKMENFVFEDSTPCCKLRLLDFGLSRQFHPQKHINMTTIVGTREYLAPEVIKGKYNEKCDVWAIGIIMYFLLAGHFPFRGKCDGETMYQILEKMIRFPHKKWAHVSVKAKDLITTILEKDNRNRPSATKIKMHRFFDENDDSGSMDHRTLDSGELAHNTTQMSLSSNSPTISRDKRTRTYPISSTDSEASFSWSDILYSQV